MKYKPISCDYYDELTLLAMRRTVCPIVFKNEEGREVAVNAAIKDVLQETEKNFCFCRMAMKSAWTISSVPTGRWCRRAVES